MATNKGIWGSTQTKHRFNDIKNKITVERGGVKTTEDFVLNNLMDIYWNKGINK